MSCSPTSSSTSTYANSNTLAGWQPAANPPAGREQTDEFETLRRDDNVATTPDSALFASVVTPLTMEAVDDFFAQFMAGESNA